MSNKSSTVTGRGDVPRHATKRLLSEYKQLKNDPERYIIAEPDPSNLLNWHYVITGPPDTPYYNGIYHGMLKFPKEYPFKPPSILMFTPNGRFLTNKRLCLSMSDYHPERWNPAWGVGTILVGLLSFMNSNESEKSLGVITTSNELKEKLAEESFDFNRKTERGHGALFNELFTIFMWEEEERREHRLKRRKMEESKGNVGRMIGNSKNSENGENFSDSKNLDSSSEKSCSSDENECSGNSSSSNTNDSPDKSKNTSHNTSNSTSNSVMISGDCENSGEDVFKKELDDAISKGLNKFDRSKQMRRPPTREEQGKLDLQRFRKMGKKLKKEQQGVPENRAKNDEKK